MDKRLTPARIALLYAAFASLWIFASDKLLLTLVDSKLLLQISMYKGLAFVLITTFLLYLLLQTMTLQSARANAVPVADEGSPRVRRLILIFLALALIVPLFGIGIASLYGPRIQQAAFDDLSAIARLKAEQVERWLLERNNDAEELANSSGLISRIDNWLRSGNAGDSALVLARLKALDRVHGYEPVLLRPDGHPAIRKTASTDSATTAVWRDLLQRALESGHPQRSNLYLDGSNKARLDIMVPLHLAGRRQAVGAIVLRAPVEQFLFPLIQSWPTASPSAETVLARRDGNDILYLNELRHRPGSAMSLRVPLNTPGMPAAASIRTGQPHTMMSIDYRGIPILAATRPIQNTDWHLVAKIDRAEIMALLKEMLFWVSLIAIVAITVVAGAVLMLWRQQQRLYQMQLQAKTTEQDKQLKLFYDLPFIGMAISSPSSKAWLYANDHLCAMLGYTREELLQTTWPAITHPDDLAGNEAQFGRMVAGEIDGYSLEKRFLRKDGTPVTVNLDIKCTRDADGKVSLIVAMIEDITERKRTEQALRESEDLFRNIFSNATDGILLGDISTRKFAMANPAAERMLGYSPGGLLSLGVDDIHPAEALPDALATFQRLVNGEITQATDMPMQRKDGSLFYADISSSPITIGGKTYLMGLVRDITERKNSEKALRESAATYRSLFQNTLNGISHNRMIFHDGEPVDYEFIAVNPGFEKSTGLKNAVGKTMNELIPGYSEHNKDSLQVFGKVARTGESARWEHYLAELDKWYAFSIYSPATGEFVVVSDDITERKRAEAALRQAAAVFESSHDGVMITDKEARILAVNLSFQAITGYSETEVLGNNPNLLQSGRHKNDFYQSMWAGIAASGYWQGDIWNRRKNGETFPAWLTISSVHNDRGETTHYVGVFSDLSKLKNSETQLEHLAHYDPLTDLPNRLLVLSHLNHALSRAQRHQRKVGVLYIDLDRFKNVNDSLGYPVGDELLVKLTERLTSHMRSDDMLARMGGDEFLLVVEYIDTAEDAAVIARSLLELLAHPFVLAGEQEIFIGASIGISIFPNDGDSADQLIRYADAAMHQAKQQGRNTSLFYTESLTRAAGSHLELETRLRHAISSQQLRVHYQPQVDIASGRIIGAEALVRWQDPQRGLIAPSSFIPLAEDTGLIGAIGEWVLREACLQGTRWIKAGLPFMTLAVNLSPHQFQRSSITDVVSRILEETGFPADHLELELTESALMQQEENAVRMLHLLRAQDIRLAIDDFGTGYSSLSYLKRFPLDVLKIDKSFVDDIPFHRDDMEIAATIIAMGHSLGFKVMAEGVENAEQLAFLQSKGCDMYQGFLTSPPLPADEFEQLLRKNLNMAPPSSQGKPHKKE